MKRWVRSLRDHIDIAERHKFDLVNRMTYNHSKVSRLEDSDARKTTAHMLIREVAKELECVREEIEAKYPHLKIYFSDIKVSSSNGTCK